MAQIELAEPVVAVLELVVPDEMKRLQGRGGDEDAPGPIPDVPEPTSGEISFLLDTVNTALAAALGPDDVIGAYAGLRPLIDTGEGRTAESRASTRSSSHRRVSSAWSAES